jgi:hypothetical protein
MVSGERNEVPEDLMSQNSSAPEETPRRDSILVYLPGGVPVLRIAIEDLLNTGWEEVFRQRASDIACAFEGSFKSCGRDDLAAVAHAILLLLELERETALDLELALKEKLTELLGRLEILLGSDEELRTG